MTGMIEKIKEGLQIFKGLTLAFGGPRHILGVDIGSYAIKIVLLAEEKGGLALMVWGYLPLGLGLDASAEERKARTTDVLRAFLREKGIGLCETATALSGNSIIVRYVKFPYLASREIAAALATEAEPFIPFDINEVQLGFHALGEVMDEGQKKTELVLVAAKKELVSARLDVLREAGLTPAIIDVDSFALENVDAKRREPGEVVPHEPDLRHLTLCLNIGHSVTNFSVIENGVTRVVRDIFISGSSLTKAVMKGLQVDAATAEKLKQTHGLIVDAAEMEKAVREGNHEVVGVSQALAVVIKDLVVELRRSVDFYLSQGSERAIGQILLSGGTARLPHLAEHLSAELKAPVLILDPFSWLSKPPVDLPAAISPAFAVAAGLALRRNGDWL